MVYSKIDDKIIVSQFPKTMNIRCFFFTTSSELGVKNILFETKLEQFAFNVTTEFDLGCAKLGNKISNF